MLYLKCEIYLDVWIHMLSWITSLQTSQARNSGIIFINDSKLLQYIFAWISQNCLFQKFSSKLFTGWCEQNISQVICNLKASSKMDFRIIFLYSFFYPTKYLRKKKWIQSLKTLQKHILNTYEISIASFYNIQEGVVTK